MYVSFLLSGNLLCLDLYTKQVMPKLGLSFLFWLTTKLQLWICRTVRNDIVSD